MRMNKVPVVSVLYGLSWFTAFLGVVAGGMLLVAGWGDIRQILAGLGVMFGAVLCAALVRVFGMIGQMLFDMNKKTFELITVVRELVKVSAGAQEQLVRVNKDLTAGFAGLQVCTERTEQEAQKMRQTVNSTVSALRQDVTSGFVDMKEQRAALITELCIFKSILEHINDDSKNLNQGIHQIRSFFEKIEAHLDLKK